MGKTEIILFLSVVTVIIFVFIAGVLLFVFQYRKRKLLYERDKEQYKLNLLNARIEIQQQTMQFIGREIHDSVAQKLTLASIYTQRMEFENHHPDLFEKLNAISQILNDSLAELRSLSKDLTDTKIQNANFTELLQHECSQVNATGICSATAESTVSAEISIAVKSFLLRIVQEFIQNSLKHSHCRNISVSVKDTPEGLLLEMDDDGNGFDTNNTTSGGIGLNNMKRRIQLIGGKYSLTSIINGGTKLVLFVPAAELNN